MLIGLSGLAGSGKTTAIDILERLGAGVRVYIGSFVTAEVARRGLPGTPAAEREVREELRSNGGMDAIARLALPTIHGILGAGRAALLDAIYCEEERQLFERDFGKQLICIGVQTQLPIRVERLATRPGRSLTADELSKRDSYEMDSLCLGDVMAHANQILTNDGTLRDFEQALHCFVLNLPR